MTIARAPDAVTNRAHPLKWSERGPQPYERLATLAGK